MEAPERVAPAVEFTLMVSLTEEQITPEVRVRPGPGTSVTEDGAVAMSLPAGESWRIDVVLHAPGFDFVGGSNMATMVLPAAGDSTPALFRLKARPTGGAAKRTRLFATLLHKGAYLAKLIRPITIADAAAVVEAAAPGRGGAGAGYTSALRLEAGFETPDLTLYIVEAGAGSGLLIIASPHLQTSVHAYAPPPGLAGWLRGQYQRIAGLAAGVAARGLTTNGAGAPKEKAVAWMRGFGARLYREFAPAPFKSAFWRLKDRLGERFRTIQIYTSDPVLPWELMRPSRGAEAGGFLGTEFRLARWHVSESGDMLDRPPQTMTVKQVLTIAPEYLGRKRLPQQEKELAALSGLDGFRALGGRFGGVSELFADMPDGIVHFSGHGEVTALGEDRFEYTILLEDGALDLTTWRGLARTRRGRHPLFFFNACEVGRAERIANFVDGWAPAVLEAGASGYIGGIWPLTDRGAFAFAAGFYRGLDERLARGPVYVTELLRRGRGAFLETGDPTSLGYAFYGDVNLRLRSPR